MSWLAVDLCALLVASCAALFTARYPLPANLARCTYASIGCAMLFAVADMGSRVYVNTAYEWWWSSALYISLTGLVLFWWLLAFRIYNPADNSRLGSVRRVSQISGGIQLAWVVVILANPWHQMFVSLQPDRYVYLDLWYVYATHQYLFMALTFGAGLMILRGARYRTDRVRGITIATGTLLPFTGNLVHTLLPQPLPFDPTQIGVAICIGLYLFAIYHKQVYSTSNITLANALDWTTTPTLLTDTAGRLVHINDSARQLFAMPLEPGQDLLAPLTRFLFDPQSGAKLPEDYFSEHLRDLTGESTADFLAISNNGQKIGLQLRVLRVGNQEFATAALWQLNHQPLQQLPAPQPLSLDTDSRAIAQQQDQRLSRMAIGITHHFNNLMMVVRGNAELAQLQLADEQPRVQGLLQRIIDSVSEGTKLTDMLSAYTARQAQQSPAIALSDLIRESISSRHRTLAQTAIEWQLAPELPRIRADAEEIRQTLNALLDNAQDAIGDAHPAGLITVTTGLADLSDTDLAYTQVNDGVVAGQCVYLRVTDNGCGMAPATSHHMFDPYFTTKGLGRGLGLATAMRLRGSALTVESALDHGTSVTVYFNGLAEQSVETEIQLSDLDQSAG